MVVVVTAVIDLVVVVVVVVVKLNLLLLYGVQPGFNKVCSECTMYGRIIWGKQFQKGVTPFFALSRSLKNKHY